MLLSVKLRLVIYILIFGIGLFLRFAPPLISILDCDSGGYLLPAVRYLMDGEFYHIYARSYPYPLFLTIVLSVFKNINAIVIVQHILSAFSFILLILTIEKYWIRPRYTSILISLAFCALLFWDENIIGFEKMTRPEGLVMPTTILLIVLITLYFNEIKSKYNSLCFGLCVFVLFFFGVMHARLMPAFFLTIIILTVHYIINLKSFLNASLAIFLAVILGFVCIYPESYLIRKYDRDTPAFSYMQFYYSNAFTVLKAINDGNAVEGDFDNKIMKRDLLLVLNDKNDEEAYPILKYNIDKLQYDLARQKVRSYMKRKVISRVRENTMNLQHTTIDTAEVIAKIVDEHNSYYYSWTKVLFFKYPFEVINKMGRQLSFALFSENNNFVKPIILERNSQCFDKSFEPYFSYLMMNFKYKPDETIKIQYVLMQRNLYRLVSITLRGLFLLSILWTIFFLFSKKEVGLIVIVFQIITIYLFTVSLFHTFDIGRYLASLSPFIYIFIMLFLFGLEEQLKIRKL